MKLQRGFTLIELVVVVLIIAILGAIAVPTYHQYVLRTHRTDAQRQLLEAGARQERYFYAKNAYAGDLADIGMSSTVPLNASGDDITYTLEVASVATAANPDYTLKATPQNGQTDDTCGWFEIDRAGEKTAESGDEKCWGK